jgi:thiol:disulfide interchange protein DsbD
MLDRVWPWIAALTVSTVGSGALAQGLLDGPLSSGEEKPHATLRLATAAEKLTPGETEIAVVFDIDPGWHLYWKNPGDTGLPPSIEFDLPEGVELAGDLRWPAPKRYIHGGGRLLDYIYEKELALLQPVRIDSSLAGETVAIGASGTWLVCKEACLPGEGADRLMVEIASDASAATADADLIERMSRRVPVSAGELGVRTSWDGLTLVIEAQDADRLEYLPLHPPLGGPANPIGDAAGFGEELRVPFDPKVREAAQVRGVVGVWRDGTTRYATITPAAPPG